MDGATQTCNLGPERARAEHLSPKWTGDGVCSQSGQGERHHRACPRNARLTTGTGGPLSQGAQNAPRLCSTFPPTCVKKATPQGGRGATSTAGSRSHGTELHGEARSSDVHLCSGRRTRRDTQPGARKESQAQIRLLCGRTESIRPSWQLDHPGCCLRAH